MPSRRLQRLEVAAAGGGGILATALAHESAALAAAAAAADEAQTHADFLRTALEVICLTLAAALPHNDHLVYALLERARSRLRADARSGDLVGNVDRVIDHFGAGLTVDHTTEHATPSVAGAEPSAIRMAETVWSVDKVLGHIRAAAVSWNAGKLVVQTDLKFTYEQEESPEEFFTLYLQGRPRPVGDRVGGRARDALPARRAARGRRAGRQRAAADEGRRRR